MDMLRELKITKVRFPSVHFAFNDYAAAFDHYAAAVNDHGAGKVQFVVSEHLYTSGYWVEQAGCECSLQEVVVLPRHVSTFRKMIEAECRAAENEGRRPRFVRYTEEVQQQLNTCREDNDL